MAKARLRIETLAAFSTPTVKPSLRPGSLSLEQVKKLPTAPQREREREKKHNGGMHTHTHTHIRKHTAENWSPTGYAYSPGCCLSHRLPTMLHPGEGMCERKKSRRERIIHRVRGKKTRRRERGQEKAKRENKEVSFGTKKTQWKLKIERVWKRKCDEQTEEGGSHENRSQSNVALIWYFLFAAWGIFLGKGGRVTHARLRLLASRPAARLRCPGCSLGLNKSHI